MYLMNLLALTLMLFATGPLQAMYKCTGADEKASFQDLPCASGAKVESLRATASIAPMRAPRSDVTPPMDWKKINADVDLRMQIQRAVEEGRAVRGMTRAQLDTAMGAPTKVNSGDYAAGSTEQRIYERRETTWYVYTNNGVVTAVQTQQSFSTTANTASCPSAFEIKSEEISANSITLGDGERAERQRRISKMKECSR